MHSPPQKKMVIYKIYSFCLSRLLRVIDSLYHLTFVYKNIVSTRKLIEHFFGYKCRALLNFCGTVPVIPHPLS